LNPETNPKIAVVIPCFKVSANILQVLASIGHEVDHVYIIDDCCPEYSGNLVAANYGPERVTVIRHSKNLGVGGSVMTGYSAAIADGYSILVKIDGDGQMDPFLLPDFVNPIVEGEADYTKGNRFFDIESVKHMPKARLLGNSVLSFFAKLSTGYWNLFDPNNGFTAIHADVARHLPFQKISRRYFFETDMLFRLNTLRAVVVDVPMNAKYGNEVSNLKISEVILEFATKHLINALKRLFYNYYLRDLSLASIELPTGFALLSLGLAFGTYHWIHSYQMATTTPAGTVILAAIFILVGLQLLLAFFGSDIANVPTRPIHRNLRRRQRPIPLQR
jgi:dolichol-phosphate mannosyltransferase